MRSPHHHLLLHLLLPCFLLAAPDFSAKTCSLEKRLIGGENCFLEPECHEECSPAKDEECKKVLKRECLVGQDQQCRLVDEEVCDVENKEEVERCEDRPKQICEVVDVQRQCRDVTNNVCETKWVPEETQECKDNVDECVDVTKPFCREVVDHVCKEKLTYRLEQKCTTRNITQCRKIKSQVGVDQVKLVKEQVCRDIPGQECKIELVTKPDLVKRTECKVVEEQKCGPVEKEVEKVECQPAAAPQCRQVSTKGVKTVERRECSTILENVCKVTFVTECDNNNDNSNKTPSSQIDSYGAPKAPLLRGKRQVAIDSYGAPIKPVLQPTSSTPTPICRKVAKRTCSQQPKETCSLVPKEIETLVTREVCEEPAGPVCKTVKTFEVEEICAPNKVKKCREVTEKVEKEVKIEDINKRNDKIIFSYLLLMG